MAYAVRADIEKLHGKRFLDDIADRDRDGETDALSVDEAIMLAAGEIDAYLSVRYAVPIPTGNVPGIVKTATIEIAVYRLANSGGLVTEDIRKRYEDMIKLLEKIAAGKANVGLPIIDNGATPPVAENFIVPTAMFGTVSRR